MASRMVTNWLGTANRCRNCGSKETLRETRADCGVDGADAVTSGWITPVPGQT